MVTPIFKNGNKNDVENSKVVDHPSVLCKIVEQILLEEISRSKKEISMLEKSQQVFLKEKSLPDQPSCHP